MGFFKLCVYTSLTLLLWDFGLVDAKCGDHTTCNYCKANSDENCEWCVRGIQRGTDKEPHFGHCVDGGEKCKPGDTTDSYLRVKMDTAGITDVTWTASSKGKCEKNHLTFHNSLKEVDSDECTKSGHMLCRFKGKRSQFDMCFKRFNETACSNLDYKFNGVYYYVYMPMPIRPCYEYLTCNGCYPLKACTWCVIRFDGENAFGRCVKANDCNSNVQPVPALAGIDVTLHEAATCANGGMVDSHAAIFSSQATCFGNNDLLCNFAEVSSNTGTEVRVFDMCFEQNANRTLKCPIIRNRIGTRDYKVTRRTETDYKCEGYASCKECNASLTHTGYKCEWCVRGIDKETHFGHCVDGEEKCKPGDTTDSYLRDKMDTAGITDVTWTASSEGKCEKNHLTFHNSLKKMDSDECIKSGHMLCVFCKYINTNSNNNNQIN